MNMCACPNVMWELIFYSMQPLLGNDEPSSAGNGSQLTKKKREDFTFDKIIGEGSYSTVGSNFHLP